MSTSSKRLAAVSAATLALIVAGTAVASAHGPWRDDGFGRGGFGPGGPFRERMAERFGPMGLGSGSVVRVETTLDLGDDGIVVRRHDRGSVTEVGDTSLTYTLVTGETALVATDDDTTIVATRDSRVRRFRVNVEEIALADIAVGDSIVVRAESQADGSFLARQIIVLPAAAADTADDASASETETGLEASATPEA